MKHWRWYLIGACLLILALTAGTELVGGFFPVTMVLPLWALRAHVIYEPRIRVTDADLWAWLDRG